MRKDYIEPDDYEYEPTPHDDVLDKARQHSSKTAIKSVGDHGAGGSENRQTGGLPHKDATLEQPLHLPPQAN